MAIDAKYIIQLKGRAYPTWPGVLDAATKAGLKSITTELVQAPAPENGQLAIVQATAVFGDDRVFTDLGDAGPQNCAAQIAAAAVRMASTRAKGRCLRDALNIGETMYEELPEEERQLASPAGNGRGHERPPAVRHSPKCESCGVELPGDIYQASMKKFDKRAFCVPCGKAFLQSQRAAAEAAVEA